MTVIYIVARPSPTWAVVQSLASWELGTDRKFTEPRRLDVVLRGKLPLRPQVPRLNQFADPERAIAISAGTQPAEQVHPVVVEQCSKWGSTSGTPNRKSLPRSWHKMQRCSSPWAAETTVPMCQVDDWPLPDPRIKALIPSDRHGKTFGNGSLDVCAGEPKQGWGPFVVGGLPFNSIDPLGQH